MPAVRRTSASRWPKFLTKLTGGSSAGCSNQRTNMPWKRVLVLPVVLAFVVLLAGSAFSRTDAGKLRTLEFSFLARWPATFGAQGSYVRRYNLRAFGVQKVRVFVGDVEVGKEPGDYIVACAHRGPSFASQTWLSAGNFLYLLLVLETGRCSPGPSVAGKSVPVTIFVTPG
jgi:hypothetical protein